MQQHHTVHMSYGQGMLPHGNGSSAIWQYDYSGERSPALEALWDGLDTNWEWGYPEQQQQVGDLMVRARHGGGFPQTSSPVSPCFSLWEPALSFCYGSFIRSSTIKSPWAPNPLLLPVDSSVRPAPFFLLPQAALIPPDGPGVTMGNSEFQEVASRRRRKEYDPSEHIGVPHVAHTVSVSEMRGMSQFAQKVPEMVTLRLQQLSEEGCNLVEMLDDRAWSALAALSKPSSLPFISGSQMAARLCPAEFSHGIWLLYHVECDPH